jgi:hypothetical protein
MPDSMTRSYMLKSPNLLVMKRTDPKNRFETGRNLVVDRNTIKFT